MAHSHLPHTVSPCAGCLSRVRAIPTSDTPDTAPLHARYAAAIFSMSASCVLVFARMPVHSSGLVSEGQPTFRLYAARIASRLARGVAPSNPGKLKGRECGEARQACSHCRRRRARIPGKTRHPPLQCGAARHEHVELHPPLKNAGRETAVAGTGTHRCEHQPACEMGQHLQISG